MRAIVAVTNRWCWWPKVHRMHCTGTDGRRWTDYAIRWLCFAVAVDRTAMPYWWVALRGEVKVLVASLAPPGAKE